MIITYIGYDGVVGEITLPAIRPYTPLGCDTRFAPSYQDGPPPQYMAVCGRELDGYGVIVSWREAE